MACKQCNKELEKTNTKPRVFCSDSCRMAYHRKIPNIVKEITNKDNEQLVTDNLPSTGYKFKAVPGRCHGCSEDVAKDCVTGATEAQKDHARELICICYQCIAKGVTHKGLGVECKDYEDKVDPPIPL